MGENNTLKIRCNECGRYFHFLVPHLRVKHEMSSAEYRQRWNIPRHCALSGELHRSNCRANILERISRGEICPENQIQLMRVARTQLKQKTEPTLLQKNSARRTAQNNKIWLASPAIKPADPDVKRQAIARMLGRQKSGEKVRDIAQDLNISVSRLYAWIKGEEPLR